MGHANSGAGSRVVRSWTARRSWAALVGGAMMALAAGLGACERSGASAGGGERAGEGQDNRLTVVATTGMVGDVAARVGGERTRVTTLMGPGVDPHLYKASPGDIRVLSEADVIFYSGLHLEGRLGDTLVRMARTRPVAAVTDGLDKSRLREPPEFAGHYDPHVWFDVDLWKGTAAEVARTLAEKDGAHAAEYRERAAAYEKELDALHAWCREMLATIPAEQRVLVTAHDAFGYFGAAYGLEVRAVQGISTDSEASLQDINALVDLLVTRKVPAVFFESSVPARSVQALIEGAAARGHTVKVGGELFSDAMGPAGTPEGTYIGMVKHNVRAITAALGGRADTGSGS